MRELKFRAWWGGGMYYDLEIDFNNRSPGKHDVLLRENGEDVMREWSKNLDLMQYTGLKDKNGTEIYEGDIIRVGRLVEEVKWVADGDWLGDKQPMVGFVHYGAIYKKPIEVIGNIYENKDLLA